MANIPLDNAPDLATLDAFLASDRTSENCMQLSELDGFLTGIVVGPELIMPSTWMPMIWRDDAPMYEDMAEAQAILGIIMSRYNVIASTTDPSVASYQPVLIEADDGTIDASDWAVGFVEAISLCEDSWTPMLDDPLAAVLLTPIILIASTTDRADLQLDEDERLPDGEMDKLLADAGRFIGVSIPAIRAFFQKRRGPPPRQPIQRKRPKRRR